MQVKEQPKGEPSGSERVKGHGEHREKKMQKVALAFKSLVFSFLCLSLASAVTDRRYRYRPPVTRHALRLFLNFAEFLSCPIRDANAPVPLIFLCALRDLCG